MNFLHFPTHRQAKDYDCGPQASQAILNYYGIDLSIDKIMSIGKTSEEHGTEVRGLLRVFDYADLKYTAKTMTVEELKQYIHRDIPVLVPLQAWRERKTTKPWEDEWKEGHYVIAIGYSPRRLYFQDPASIFRTYLSYKEFDQRWHDIDPNTKEVYDHYGIAVFGKKPAFRPDRVVHMD